MDELQGGRVHYGVPCDCAEHRGNFIQAHPLCGATDSMTYVVTPVAAAVTCDRCTDELQRARYDEAVRLLGELYAGCQGLDVRGPVMDEVAEFLARGSFYGRGNTDG